MSHGAPYVLGCLDMGLVYHSNFQGNNPEDVNPSFQIHSREPTSILSLLSTWLIPMVCLAVYTQVLLGP